MSESHHIVDYLTQTRDRGGSDLHITSGAPPACRVNGELEPMAEFDLEPDETPLIRDGCARQALTFVDQDIFAAGTATDKAVA